MPHLAVVQHTQSEWLGAVEDHLEGRGIRFSYFRPFTPGGGLPAIPTLGDGLILLGGGPWGAASPDHLLPTLAAEVLLARACLMLGKPILAFGLGSQILSLAADGRVEAAPLVLEVGEAQAMPGALDGLLPERFANVVYMRDRPRPPAYADILARDRQGRPAIFRIGPSLGFTGHPGIRRAMVEDLLMEGDDAPPDAAAGLEAIGCLGAGIEDALVPIMAGVVRATGWAGRAQ